MKKGKRLLWEVVKALVFLGLGTAYGVYVDTQDWNSRIVERGQFSCDTEEPIPLTTIEGKVYYAIEGVR